jgi:hypothetical protein
MKLEVRLFVTSSSHLHCFHECAFYYVGASKRAKADDDEIENGMERSNGVRCGSVFCGCE